MNVQSAYDVWSDIYDPQENKTRDLDATITNSLLATQSFHSILELGCGTGKNTQLFADISPSVHALDFSQGMLDKAQERIKSSHVKFSQADLTKPWPCKDNSYDLLSCNLVLEHIEQLDFVFSEACRVMKKEGQFFISEYHPFRQYMGKQARFEHNNETVLIPAFQHHVSDFLHAGKQAGLMLQNMDEHWHVADEGKLPRTLTLLFTKN